MRGTFKMLQPGEMDCTLTATMKLSEWEELQKQLQNRWPSCDLGILITELVNSAKRTFSAETKTGNADRG